jgi:hypothetical protein
MGYISSCTSLSVFISHDNYPNTGGYEGRRKILLIKNYCDSIPQVVNELQMNGDEINYSQIAEKLGISKMMIKRNKELIESINNTRHSGDLY